MDFLKSVTGKVITGVVTLGVVAAGVSWYQMDPSTRSALLGGTGHIVAWLGVVLLFPWASFFLIAWVERFKKNSVSAVLILAYTLAEALLLAWLFSWHIHSATAWTFFIVGSLFAGVYNLFTCDWIAEKV